MQTRYVLGIDPGAHCGIARVTVSHTPSVVTDCLVRDTHATQYHALHDVIVDAASVAKLNQEVLHVVIEDFSTAVMLNMHGKHTLKLIGFAEGLAHLLNCPVWIQQPSARRPFELRARTLVRSQPPDRLITPHEISATAHALAWLDHHRSA